MLCSMGLMQDHENYKDLYGLTPREMQQKMDVAEIVTVTGFRASLKSEGKMTDQFQALFEQLLDVVGKYEGPTELKQGFKEDKALQNCHDGCRVVIIRLLWRTIVNGWLYCFQKYPQ
jgi:hypothetical protein